MTVYDWIQDYYQKRAARRLNRLIEISAPEIIIERTREILAAAQAGEITCTSLGEFSEWNVTGGERRTGRGGKVYYALETTSGTVHVFPQARYGLFLSRPNQK